MLALGVPTTATAQEVDDQDITAQDGAMQESTTLEGPAPAASALSFGEMGLGGSVALTGQRGRATITVPVPPGTVPVALRGVLEVPAGIDRAWLDLTHENRFVGRVDVIGGAPTAVVNVPLAGVAVTGRSVTLDLSTTVVPAAGTCLYTPDTSTVRLQDPVVDFAGVPAAPTVVADFLPPVLRTATVIAPDEPTAEQSTAVLILATTLVDFYGSQPVRVVVRSQSERAGTPADGPFDRTLVIAGGDEGAIELEPAIDPAAPPALRITGSGASLLDQIALLAGDAAALAVADRASAGPITIAPVLPAESMTLREMGLGPVTGRGAGEVTVTVPVDQTRLARAGSNLRVHLLGDYTPLSSGVAGGLRVSVGDTDLASSATDASGVLDLWVDIPPASVERVTAVTVTLRTTGNGDTCSTGGALALTVHADTTVSSSGGTPDTRGFESVPQSLMPGVSVALAEQSFANTARAAAVLTGLQRLSARPLVPTVAPFADVAAATTPALLVAPDGLAAFGPQAQNIRLPLSTTGTTVLTVRDDSTGGGGDQTQVTVDSAAPFGSVQVLRQNDRSLVVATSNGAEQLDGVLAWLGDDVRRWSTLSGDVLFGTVAREPVSLSSSGDAAVPVVDVASGSTAPSGVWAILVIGGIALVIGVIGAALVYIRSRGRSDAAAPPGERS
ncbi:hypothetical protein [Rhodococcus sp. UNC23MFCrub1.1]|uniref:hypothetical protein n=1 Tax=Rhodococcus sp. UNC23MFCrub1.1 TaxID=1449068 RepID=UPI000482DD2D|nr:hypothetical protein [Rhodococcus sp. UNC23MFCrub1.1]